MPLRRMNDLVPLARANKMPALQAKLCLHTCNKHGLLQRNMPF